MSKAVLKKLQNKSFGILKRIAEEPYRIFFPLAVLGGVLGISHWFFYAMGWIPHYSALFHASIQIQVYMGSFVLGFLLTAMPRFASAPPASAVELLIFLVWIGLIPIFYLSNHWTLGRLCFLGWMISLAIFAFKRFKRKDHSVQPPVEFIWIPIALAQGIAGTLMVLRETHKVISTPVFLKIGKLFMDQGFLLSLVLGVGAFLGPRLMGVYKPEFIVGDQKDQKRIRVKKVFTYLFLGGLLLFSFILEGLDFSKLAYFLRAFIVSAIYIPTRTINPKPLVQDPFVRLLWASFWMVFLGHWLLAFFPSFRTAMLHVIFIGGYALMTFAVSIMVIFSHGGMSSALKKNAWPLSAIAVALGATLVLRVV